MAILPPVTRGRHCPRCGGRSDRVRTPALLRPVRWMLLRSAAFRRCQIEQCGWHGFALPAPEPARPRTAEFAPEPAAAGVHGG